MTPAQDEPYVRKTDVERAIAQALTPLEQRIEALEHVVFPDDGPGSGRIPDHLARLETRLSELRDEVMTRVVSLDQKYDERIKEVIEILAELKKIVAELNQKRGRGFAPKRARRA